MNEVLEPITFFLAYPIIFNNKKYADNIFINPVVKPDRP
jgi:hypothetical protein